MSVPENTPVVQSVQSPAANHPCGLLPAFPEVERGDYAEMIDVMAGAWFSAAVYCPACLAFHHLWTANDWGQGHDYATFDFDALGTEFTANLACISLAVLARRRTFARVLMTRTPYAEVADLAPLPAMVPSPRSEIDPDYDPRFAEHGSLGCHTEAHRALHFTARATPEVLALRPAAEAFRAQHTGGRA